ncbi:hypothetical protein DTO012A8_9027 [Penicillium roqueforti]|nr:hypothetical protein DTO012A8_9027 [Penicillium roqueforti]
MSTVTAVDPHWLAELGGVFYSVKEKGYSQRDRRVTEIEFNKRMEIEEQMAADRERAAAEKLREQERNDPARRRTEIEVGGKSVVRKAIIKPGRRVGGLTASSSSSSRPGANIDGAHDGGGNRPGSSVVKRPTVPRRPGRAF